MIVVDISLSHSFSFKRTNEGAEEVKERKRKCFDGKDFGGV